MSAAPVAVIAIGNPSRGDDALGPRFLTQLAVWLEENGMGGGVDLIEDFQLQVEHALDLQGRRLVLFVDAGMGTPAPFSLDPIEATDDLGHTSHSVAPGAVLQVYRTTLGMAPPPAFVLCIRGESFELGAPMTAEAAANLQAALDCAQNLLRRPEAAHWFRVAGRPV